MEADSAWWRVARALTGRSAAALRPVGGLAAMSALRQTPGQAAGTRTQDDGGGVQALTGRSVAARSQSGELRAPSPALGQTNGQAAEALTRDDGG